MNSTTSPKKKSRSSKARKQPLAARRKLREWLACQRTAAYPLSRLECETPLLSDIVAESVCAEAANWLDNDRPMRFAPALAARARGVYEKHPRFAARLRRECRALFNRLPPEFAIGASLSSLEARTRSESVAVCQRAPEEIGMSGFDHAAAAGPDLAYFLI